jgi:hypothetical protein
VVVWVVGRVSKKYCYILFGATLDIQIDIISLSHPILRQCATKCVSRYVRKILMFKKQKMEMQSTNYLQRFPLLVVFKLFLVFVHQS